MPGYSAVLLGATGATGQELLVELLTRSAWSTVTVVHRREVPVPPSAPPEQASKLKQVIINMDELAQHTDAFANADAVFCALGTTRKAAGSAAAFKKVDLEYVAASAHAAAASKVKLYALVSSQGANASMWASDAAPFHGLLYAQTKGKAEEAVKAAGFPFISIYRPGLLDRSNTAEPRGLEVLASKVFSKLPCAALAKAIVNDAEARLQEGAPQGVKLYTNPDIKRLQAL